MVSFSMPQTKRQRLDFLGAQMETERLSFEPQYRDISELLLPRRLRLFTSDANKGDRRNKKIYDGAGTMALRTLKAGMQAGVTSPARPWMKLQTPDPDLNEYGRVKEYLDVVTKRLLMMLASSNFYNACPYVYGDMGGFGTGAVLVDEDEDSFLRYYPLPIGSYWIANDETLRVRVFRRKLLMTVRQLIGRFGKKNVATGSADWSNLSSFVKDQYDRGNYEAWVEVCHVIQPNPEFNPRRAQVDARFKAYEATYYELGAPGVSGAYRRDRDDMDRYLKESGHDFFPVLVPRWEVSGEDVYGTDCPGMTTIGDIKQLQFNSKQMAHALDIMNRPPMVAHPDLKKRRTSILPGDVTFLDERVGNVGFRSAFERIRPPVNEMRELQSDLRRAISRGMLEDIFLMFANDPRNERATAEEIVKRNEEKFVMLGPVHDQLNEAFLDPNTDIAFAIGAKRGLFPEPPEELQGMDLRVEYVSILAQAQKLVGLSSMERFLSFTGQIVQATGGDASVFDKIDVDKLIEQYGEGTSVALGVVKPQDKVVSIRAARAKAQAEQAQAEMAGQAAQAARNLSETDTGGQNALTELINQANAGSAIPA